MRVLVIYCHPSETSFSAALHKAVTESLIGAGHSVTDLDLYAENFDPVMTREEREEYEDNPRYIETVKKYAEQLAAAEALVAVYPTWWYGLPAMLKGYFDRESHSTWNRMAAWIPTGLGKSGESAWLRHTARHGG
jgi:putative NADPH-quinone reductase